MGRAFLSGGVLVSTKTPFLAVPEYTTSWFPSMPPMAGGWPSTYNGIYKAQLWVYVLVNKLGGAEARLPLPVYRRQDDDSRKRDSSHSMAKLLSAPNPGMSAYDLREWTANTENIFGRTFWFKMRQAKVVQQLFPLHPSCMEANDDGSWTFDNGRKRMSEISPADLVIFQRFDAVSPLEPLRATLENEWHARNATSSFWKRGARPGMALSHPQQLSRDAQDRLKMQMDTLHAGSGNTGGTLILEEGMEPKTMTLTAEEAQYIETRKLNREEACAAYDVPPPVVHILDRATFSNITEQMRSMYRDTMGPPLARRESAIELQLRQAEWPNDDIYAEHLMDEVLRGDFEARQDALNKAEHMTIAEKRRVENLPFIEGTDRIFLNTATLPLDAIDNQYNRPALPPAAPTEDEAAPVVRTVLGRLSWQKTLTDVDVLALVKGLPAEDALVVLTAYELERKSDGSVSGLRDRLRGVKDA